MPSIAEPALNARRHRLAILDSHPIQYFAPLYRRLAAEPDIDLTVYFCSRQSLEAYADPDFGGARLQWDIPLLDGYRSTFLPNLRGAGRISGFWSLVNPAIVTELRAGGFDALWVHGHAYATHAAAFAVARTIGLPVMMRAETHLLLSRPAIRRVLRREVLGRFYGALSAFLAIGSKNAEFYREHGVPTEKIFSVPYVVDNARFAQRPPVEDSARLRRDNGLPEGAPVILFASKLTQRKRPGDLLEAHRRLREAGQRQILVFVGDGPERAALADRVRDNAIPGVVFAGFRNQSELPAWYALSDVFVLPSEDEPWGLVVNEALCAGLPAVVSDQVGAGYDLVREGETGFSYPVGDVAALAERLGRVVADPALRRRLSDGAARRMQTWSFDQAVDGVRAALTYVRETRR